MAELILTINARQGKRGATEFTVATNKVATGAKAAAAATGRLERRMVSMGRTSSIVGGQLRSLFVGFTAIIAIRAATRAIAQFEENMIVLRNVSKATETQMASFTETSLRLGASTRFTASEVGGGLLFLARAGFTADESLSAIGGTLNLATAGLLGLGEAADLASNVVSQFNLAASETTRVGNDLVVVAARSNTSVRQLGEAFKFAGPIAALAGVSLEDTASAIGVLGDRGIQATLAGTGLRQAILRLVNPTTAAQEAIESLGLELADVNPVLLGSGGLVRAFEALGAAELDVTKAGIIFGARTAGVSAILADNIDRVKELTQAQFDNKNEAEDLARQLEDSLAGAFRALSASVEALFLKVGDDGLAGAMKSMVQEGTEVIRFFAGVESSGGALSDTVDKAQAAVKGLLAAFTAMIATRFIIFITSATRAVLTLNTAMLANPALTLVRSVGLLSGAYFLLSSRIDRAAEAQARFDTVGRDARDQAARIEFTLIQQREEEDFIGQINTMEAAVESLRTKLVDTQVSFDRVVGVQRQIPGFNITGADPLTREGLEGLPADALSDVSNQGLLDFALIGRSDVNFFTEDIEALREAILGADGAATNALALAELADRLGGGQIREILGISTEAPITLAALAAEGKTLGDVLSFAAASVGVLDESIALLQDRAAAQREGLLKGILDQEDLKNEQSALQSLINTIDEEIRVGRLSAEEKIFETLQRRAVNAAIEDGIELNKENISLLRQKAGALAAAGNIERAGISQAQQSIQALEDQIAVQRLSLIEAKILREQRAAGPDATGEELAIIEELTRQVDAAEKIRALADGIAGSIANGFEDAVFQAESLRDVLENLANDLSRLFFQQLALNPFKDFFSTLLTGGGGGFSSATALVNSGVIPNSGPKKTFAHGGIIERPSLIIPIGGGPSILAGEAGPERVTPGRGSSGTTINNTFRNTWNITTPNADSFRQSQTQIAADISRVVRREQIGT